MIYDGTLTEQQQKCIPDVSFELIPISSLVSNQEYQRPLSEGHVRRALDEFDIYQINPIKVSRRDGINFVFDGQHTCEIVAAASGSRDTPVWCMVFEDLTYKDEAHTFAEQKKHVKNLVPYEIFHAHIEAGDEKQKMIETIVRSYGLEITNTQRTDGVCAVNTLEKIYDKFGQDILDKTLRMAIATWEGENNSLSGNMLMGIARILMAYGDSLKEDIFKDRLGKVSVKSIIRTARERRPGAMGFAEAIMLAYNNRNKYRLSLRTLYGGKNIVNDPDEPVDEEEDSKAGNVSNGEPVNS